jgi:hypothetical protein
MLPQVDKDPFARVLRTFYKEEAICERDHQYGSRTLLVALMSFNQAPKVGQLPGPHLGDPFEAITSKLHLPHLNAGAEAEAGQL